MVNRLNTLFTLVSLLFLAVWLGSCTESDQRDEYYSIRITHLPSGGSIKMETALIDKSRFKDTLSVGMCDSMYMILRLYDNYPVYSQILFLKKPYRHSKIYVIDSVKNNMYYVHSTEIHNVNNRVGHLDGKSIDSNKTLKASYLVIVDSTDNRSNVGTIHFETGNATLFIPEKYYTFISN